MRLLLEVAAEVKKRVSKTFVVGVKINSVEFQADGFQPEEATVLCQALERAEFDYVELSGGTYEKIGFQHYRESTRKRENFFIEFAEQIVRPLKTLKVYTTGGFKTVGGMVDAMKTVDGVGLGKAAGQEPRLPNDLLAGKFTGVVKPVWDENNPGTGLFVTGAQIKRIAQGSEPLDLSDPEQTEGIMNDIQAHFAKLAQDEEGYYYGTAPISRAAVPYGHV
ncbi:oxidoreductase [Fusarium oxysporum f. sp. raphani 54005]|uniref:Oxidoreductase n=2 Tax=Fusarium oxysporum f. sp. raphani TaxID=96318 RepID=X0BGG6_FUSOX|nr:oxidoreductase [Fusarium oxysporum f. sp. raphani 54005]KAG7408100.1 NADH-dependent flavin oxidoreductase nadA [Fusarium oxysporum f. sp. raphani]